MTSVTIRGDIIALLEDSEDNSEEEFQQEIQTTNEEKNQTPNSEIKSNLEYTEDDIPEELKEVFIERRIFDFFIDILWAPEKKVINTEKVAGLVGQEKKGIFFGDSPQDMESAESCGLDFVFVKEFSEWVKGESTAKNKGHRIIKNFKW